MRQCHIVLEPSRGRARHAHSKIRAIAVVVLLASAAAAGRVEILRDTWGVPHIFADSDAGAFYGLGYATAEDRGLQMTYSLRIIQGRLSEVIGEVSMLGRKESSVDHDRKMRTFGFYRVAQRTAAALDEDMKALLQAYCDGVNAAFERNEDHLHPLFADLGVEPEPWTPADCLASWWHMGQFFATDGTRDLIAGRNEAGEPEAARGRQARRAARGGVPRPVARGGRSARAPLVPPDDMEKLPPDEAPAVVQRGDVSDEWIRKVDAYARELGLVTQDESPEGPKFSHAWVVGGKRTTTGSAVLVSDPQTPVRNPSLFHEFHIVGKTFNARGIGVPGSPVILIGFTDRVAWGVTALGADQADLFLIETDPGYPDRYRFDDAWRPMTVHREPIRVRGRDPVEFTVRETHLGPVATAFCFARSDEGHVALKRVPICEADRETVQALVPMLRSANAAEFDAALERWRFPSVNILFGDHEGNIGYRALAAIPLRSPADASAGRTATRAHTAVDDWRGYVPFDLLPHVMNPAAGFLYSGNHRSIGSWYPVPFGGMTGQGGDTVRSWRLRELLQARETFTPEQVRTIHEDAVNPARREIVRIGLHLRDALHRELSADAARALTRLEPWCEAGASSDLAAEGAELAAELNTFFRFVNTDLAYAYGGGESGLAYFLKTAAARIARDPKAGFDEVEQDFVDRSLASAWQSATRKYGNDPTVWALEARKSVTERSLGYYESLDRFPALDREHALSVPALAVVDGGTIRSQASQCYTQWVPMDDPDRAMTVLPPGQTEGSDSRWRTSTMDLWARGELHPAPLSRGALEPLVVERTVLSYDGGE